ncbi:MAG: PAS domain-containing protein, partial [Verrucomicrobiaceae bacterium]
LIPGNVISDRRLDPSTQALTLADVRRPGSPLVWVNQGFEKMTGYTRDEAVGRNCRFLQGPDTSTEAVAQMREAISREESLIVDVLNYRKSGTAFWNRLSLVPVLNSEGKAMHYIGIQSDITGMKALQDRLHELVTKTYLVDKLIIE